MTDTFQIVSGRPDDVEIAAVVTVLLAVGDDSRVPVGRRRPATRWAAPAAMVREWVPVTGGGWGVPTTADRR